VIDRNVWIFPIRPIPENDVKKPAMFVFKDIADYKTRGKNIDTEYSKLLAEQKKFSHHKSRKPTMSNSVTPSTPHKSTVVPADIVGKQIKHKSYGKGTITEIAGDIIIVSFHSVGKKKLGYEFCIKNKLVVFV
jgi:hypothetical protein